MYNVLLNVQDECDASQDYADLGDLDFVRKMKSLDECLRIYYSAGFVDLCACWHFLCRKL